MKEFFKFLQSKLMKEYVWPVLQAVVIAVFIRSFFYEPYKIPSGSMIPTLLVGDHIFVKRFAYGLRLPFTTFWLYKRNGPERGDVIVFDYPKNTSISYIKRVIGLPGDTVVIRAGKVYVNQQAYTLLHAFKPTGPLLANSCQLNIESAPQFASLANDFPNYQNYQDYSVFVEQIDSKTHLMQTRCLNQQVYCPAFGDFTDPIHNNSFVVPPGQYFVMGDNRDESEDSRFWGFVPRDLIKGKAEFIWLSFNDQQNVCVGNPDIKFRMPLPSYIENPITGKSQLEFIPRRPLPIVRWDRFGRDII